MNDSKVQIFPRCKSDMHCAYISAEGIVYPCCWLGNYPHNESYKKFHGENLDKVSLRLNDLEEILEGAQFKRIEQSWISDPIAGCKIFCGKRPHREEKFLDGTNESIRVYFDHAKI